jgi:hypothetical protein
MDGVSYTTASQAQSHADATLIALRQIADAQRQVAEMLSRQVEQAPPPANPPHLGQRVDTYA